VLRSECVTVGALGAVEKQDQLLLNPFEHQVSMQVKRRVDEKDALYLSGECTDGFGFFSLLETAGGVTGYISLADYLYRVEPAEKGLHRILEIDRRLFIPEETAPDYPQSDAVSFSNPIPLSPSVKTTRTTPARIDVLVAYTDDVAAAYSQTAITNEINLAIERANDAYSNSGVEIELNLVHKVEIVFTEGNNAEYELNTFAAMSSIQALRNQYGADVCALVVQNTNAAGRAKDFSVGEADAYCLAEFGYVASQWTLGHEIGHLIGARHQYIFDDNGDYEHGHFHNGDYYPFRTMMAVYDLVRSQGPRIPYYSEPSESYYGDPLGVITVSENERFLNENRNTIPAFRNPPPVVSVTGYSTLAPNQTGSWMCHIDEAGHAPYHYQWYCRYPEGLLLRDPNSRKPPAGYWFTLGTDSPYLSRSDDEDFELKCVVTDDYQRQSETPVFYVTVSGAAKQMAQAESSDPQYSTPLATGLGVNYPNPFNPQTVIPYSLAGPAKVHLAVFCVDGRCVSVIVDEGQAAGRYEAVFNANDLPSGIYYCRMTVQGRQFVKKMLYVK